MSPTRFGLPPSAAPSHAWEHYGDREWKCSWCGLIHGATDARGMPCLARDDAHPPAFEVGAQVEALHRVTGRVVWCGTGPGATVGIEDEDGEEWDFGVSLVWGPMPVAPSDAQAMREAYLTEHPEKRTVYDATEEDLAHDFGTDNLVGVYRAGYLRAQADGAAAEKARIREAVAAERQRCAMVCEALTEHGHALTLRDAARRIREGEVR